MSEITKTQVKYRVLIKSQNDYFKIGTILIKRLEGDIFYIPSQRFILQSNCGVTREIMDHISWHKSGQVHFKIQNGRYEILEVGKEKINLPKIWKPERQGIQDIGFQEMIRDTILDFSKLPKFKKNVDNLDVLFDVNNYNGPVEFVFSIISGWLIVKKWLGENVPIKEITDETKSRILATQKRCLGKESNNADKLLQYTLLKYERTKELPLDRGIFIPSDLKISRKI